MAPKDETNNPEKSVPLKDLLKKQNSDAAKQSDANDSSGRKKKKLLIKKNKKEGAQQTQAKESKPPQDDTRLVSSLEHKRDPVNQRGGVKDPTAGIFRTEKPEPVVSKKERQQEEAKAQEQASESKRGEMPPASKEATPPSKEKEATPSSKEKEATPPPNEKEGTGESRKKKSKDKKEQKKEDWQNKKKQEEEERFNKSIKQRRQSQEQQERLNAVPKQIEILESISVGDLAQKLNLKVSDVIAELMKMGMMVSINNTLDSDTASLVAHEFGAEVKIISLFEETIIEHGKEDRQEDYSIRPPVVTIMGHVDHGKTKLLDAIRSSNVIDSEAGGITQHIGAYQVTLNDKKVTFLDTPGHEAFTMMRSRGAGVTDIVVLMVAADDGVMPQTLEAANHAQAAGVPIIVAINKIDKEGANPERIKQELSQYHLVPEEWGGETIYVEISAKQRINIEHLIEMIQIQADVLNLKANPTIPAQGTVVEAKLDQGRGPVATVLIQHGTLSVGDPFVAGIYYGKVRAMFNDKEERIQVGYPSDPLEIIGITGVPEAGDPIEAVESERYAKQICQKRQELRRIEVGQGIQKVTLEHLNEMISKGTVKELKVIIKSDVRGSAEALREALENLSTEDVTVKSIHTGTGAIIEGDIMLAAASNAVIIGFHVRPNSKAAELAVRENVEIKYYNIIYNAVDDIKGAMVGMLDPELQEQALGSGEIREVFKISKVGAVAGAYVLKGKISRNNKIRLIREGEILYDGSFRSLKRFREDVNEVHSGYECGFSLEGFNDIKEGDTFETYEVKEVKRSL